MRNTRKEHMADEPEPQVKSKLIIDEDWKSQAQAEKEALDRQIHQQPAQPQAEAAPLPPATLDVLFTTLAAQSLMAMGQVPHPVSGKHEARLDEAKHHIDTLDMLETKTAGNRTPEETQLLDNLLHELRMVFVEMQKHLAGK